MDLEARIIGRLQQGLQCSASLAILRLYSEAGLTRLPRRVNH